MFENQEERENTEYNIAIVPVLDVERRYIEKMPSLKDIGITGEYFVYVTVSTPINEHESQLGKEFYIKDDKTLIVMYNDVYYELVRVSYNECVEDTRV